MVLVYGKVNSLFVYGLLILIITECDQPGQSSALLNNEIWQSYVHPQQFKHFSREFDT
jgi:hypothetical protein